MAVNDASIRCRQWSTNCVKHLCTNDVQSFEIQSSDVQSSDVQSSDVQSSDVQSSNVHLRPPKCTSKSRLCSTSLPPKRRDVALCFPLASTAPADSHDGSQSCLPLSSAQKHNLSSSMKCKLCSKANNKLSSEKSKLSCEKLEKSKSSLEKSKPSSEKSKISSVTRTGKFSHKLSSFEALCSGGSQRWWLVLLLSLLTVGVSPFNLSPKSAVIFEDPHGGGERPSYFGYAVGLRSRAKYNDHWVLVGAPRSNVTPTPAAPVGLVEPGALYKCPVGLMGGGCRQLILDDLVVVHSSSGNVAHNMWSGELGYHDLKDHGWLGGSIDTQQGDREATMVSWGPSTPSRGTGRPPW
ncbi:hypothetical protein FHG87_020441 [Trinorchestia longiramus]|nr:hypothetical protein FHG87_020441 [Trinorchestia longiramus]